VILRSKKSCHIYSIGSALHPQKEKKTWNTNRNSPPHQGDLPSAVVERELHASLHVHQAHHSPQNPNLNARVGDFSEECGANRSDTDATLEGAYVGGVDAVDGDDGVAAAGSIGGRGRGGEGAGDVADGGGRASGEAGVPRLRTERRMGLGFGGEGEVESGVTRVTDLGRGRSGGGVVGRRDGALRRHDGRAGEVGGSRGGHRARVGAGALLRLRWGR